MRTLARQIRHRWQAGPGEPYPARLQAWLDTVDTVVATIPGTEAHNGVRDESVASHN